MTFSTLLDIQLTINTLSVVIAAFRLTKSLSVIEYVESFAFFCTVVAQLAFICWKSSDLIYASTDIGKAAYEVDWINGSEKVRSAVKMITIRTQKPLKLTALRGLVMFDLETLVDIMRLSYTCFTVVKSLDT
nr:odorant receptor 8 [Subpsaltria yangi]